MMWPVLTKVRYELLGGILRQRSMWGQLAISLVANWLVGPAVMVGPPLNCPLLSSCHDTITILCHKCSDMHPQIAPAVVPR